MTQQTKYPNFIITFDIANLIVEILIEQCKVAANSKLKKLYKENKYESNNCRTN